ncbi:MAG: ATP-binding protein, partial [Chloroflexi bacterium]|nr:ATP-binding protein [Chloroflexota bacterium]
MSERTENLNLDLQYLQAELARIDIRIQCEVRKWQLAGQDPGDGFRGLYLNDEQVNALLSRPLGTTWGQMVTLDAEEESLHDEMEGRARALAEAIVETAKEGGEVPRLRRLTAAFGLSRFELDVLLICLAPHLDLRYEHLYGYLQDDVTRRYATVSLILGLLCQPGADRLRALASLGDNGPLFRGRLLNAVPGPPGERRSVLSRSLDVSTAVATWLLGSYCPDSALAPYVRLVEVHDDHEACVLVGDTWEDVAKAADSDALLIFWGSDLTAQEAAAALVAQRARRSLLRLDMRGVVSQDESVQDVLQLALRDARLISSVLLVVGWDAVLSDGAAPASLLRELCAHPHLTVISSESMWRAQGISRTRDMRWLEFPMPEYGSRLRLWQYYLGKSVDDETLELADLAGQFALTSSQIRDAVATARDLASQRGEALDRQDLFAAARSHSNPRLSGLARRITPRFIWSDIVLPQDQLEILREIVQTVRHRPKVLGEWGVGRKLASSHGITVLFAGPPGTGKTMAAEVLANELDLELYKIDLSTVVSKYIGETEKNLEQIFREAQSSNAILFFDEADAIFGKRSEVKDAHDRYANIEIS